MSNQLRIIGGKWRSRQISFDDAPGLRPTPSRVRETLFNWLQGDIHDSRCLDLFAGSGALGFEAASRGAGLVVQVESNPIVHKKLQENASKLMAENIQVKLDKVDNYLLSEPIQFDLVFMDPPFGKNYLVDVCCKLESGGWLTDHAKIYLESEVGVDLASIPQSWEMLKSKKAGEVSYFLYRRNFRFC